MAHGCRLIVATNNPPVRPIFSALFGVGSKYPAAIIGDEVLLSIDLDVASSRLEPASLGAGLTAFRRD